MLGQYVRLPKNKEIEISPEEQKEPYTPQAKVRNSPSAQELHEVKKEQMKEKVKHSELLDVAVDRSKTVLLRTKAVFPFDFFPNEIIIDMEKVTVIDHSFFMSGGIKSIYLRDIVDVEIEAGPLFSKLVIIDQYFTETKIGIRYLKKSDAIKCRELIMGMVGAIKTNVDVGKLDSNTIINKMRYLSRTKKPISP